MKNTTAKKPPTLVPFHAEDAFDFLMSIADYLSLQSGSDEDGAYVEVVLGGDDWGLSEATIRGRDLPEAVERTVEFVAREARKRLIKAEELLGRKVTS